MRDQMDAEMWIKNHDQFSEWMDGALRAAGGSLRRAVTAGVPGQLVAAIFAVSLTLATFSASAA